MVQAWIHEHILPNRKEARTKISKPPFEFLKQVKILKETEKQLTLVLQWQDDRVFVADIGGFVELYGRKFFDPCLVRLSQV